MSLPHNEHDDHDVESNCPIGLHLITIAGTTIRIDAPVSIYHTWEILEEYLVEHLPIVSHLDTFGCELTLLDFDTHQVLQDPVQEDLWWNTQFHLVVHEKEQLQGIEHEDHPKAIQVPANDTGILEAKAFFAPPARQSGPTFSHNWPASLEVLPLTSNSQAA